MRTRAFACALVAIVACKRDHERVEPPSPAPAVAAQPAPPRAPPTPPPPVDLSPRYVVYEYGGLGVWRNATCGCMFRIELDLASATLDVTTPDTAITRRALDTAAAAKLRELVEHASAEPPPPGRTSCTDFGTRLDITTADRRSLWSASSSCPFDKHDVDALAQALDTYANTREIERHPPAKVTRRTGP
jgi:hypothetical protein